MKLNFWNAKKMKDPQNRKDPGYQDDGKCDIGNRFDPPICLIRYLHATKCAAKLEKEGKPSKFNACEFCPLIIEHLKKTKKVEIKMTENSKRDNAIIRPRAGTVDECVECGAKKRIFCGGICSKCYYTPGIKEKHILPKYNRKKVEIISTVKKPELPTKKEAEESKQISVNYESTTDAILKKAVAHFGIRAQMLKLAEECSELSAAISRYFSESLSDNKEIVEEAADVEIMLEQLRLILGNKEIDSFRDFKLTRLSEVIEK